jgi:aminoglycoside phosphotransferase (APT) family kinase protein
VTSFLRTHSPEWVGHLAAAGYPGARPLAAGVEGAVYRLADGTVAKVWGHRRPDELLPWQAFYADVAAAGLPFATPVILRVDEVEGIAVTVERHLPGTPLQRRLDTEAAEMPPGQLPPGVVDAMVGILRALATVPATTAMRRLPALDESEPFRPGDFGTDLIALVERRTARSGDLLRAHVPDFDRRYAAVRAGLAALDPVPDSVLHGDLFADNVLADPSGRPTAVLDFGFVAGAGDPRFDAGVTAGIMDMYGPHAAAITGALTERFAAELGHAPEVLRLYRAAYALATHNAFTTDGSDGHFGWCVRQLAPF